MHIVKTKFKWFQYSKMLLLVFLEWGLLGSFKLSNMKSDQSKILTTSKILSIASFHIACVCYAIIMNMSGC